MFRRFRLLVGGFLLVLSVSVACVGVSAATPARISAHLTSKSFTATQAGSVKVRYKFRSKSSRFAYVLSRSHGRRWRRVRRVRKRGRFRGSHTMSVKRVFGPEPITAGRYRLKLSSSASSVTVRFTVKPVSRTVVVVSNTSDVVNGKVSSIAALNTRPGRDGISLREALEAADNTGGTKTVYIMFSHRLNGKTIEIRSEPPAIRRNHLVLEGVAPNGAPARVTLDGRHEHQGPLPVFAYSLVLVHASEVTIRWLRFTGVSPVRESALAMVVGPGWESDPKSSLHPASIANVRIEDNVFDQRGFSFTATSGRSVGALYVGPGLLAAQRHSVTHVRGVTIARNTFLNYDRTGADTVSLGAAAVGATISGARIEDNTFEQDTYSIELSTSLLGGAERISGTRIVGNTITSSLSRGIGITLGNHNAGANARIDNTLIADNSIGAADGNAINITAELDDSGYAPPGGDVVANTQVVNDVLRLAGSESGIYVSGNNAATSAPSSVQGLTVQNDTLVDDGNGTLLTLIPNSPGLNGNTITGVTVRNSILYAPNGTPIGTGVVDGGVQLQPPNVVTHSLISGTGWAGSDGNINAGPGFVDEPGGNYRLTAGSPAINAGTVTGAPADDITGAQRDAQPDIGAYEYGAVPRPLLTVTVYPLAGSGTVASTPAGVNCATGCSARFALNARVTLTARPTNGSRFLGWRGACSGTRRCTVKLTASRSVTARFGPG